MDHCKLTSVVEQLHPVSTDEGLGQLIERLTQEGLISMRDAALMYGRGTHRSTPMRHALKGHRLPDGTVVKLEAIRVGNALCTSRPAVLRYFAAQNAAGVSRVHPKSDTSTPANRNRAQAAAHTQVAQLLGAN